MAAPAERRGLRRAAGAARELAVATAGDVKQNRTLRLGAELAYFTLLSLPPGLLVVLGLAGYIGRALGPTVVEQIRARVVDLASGFLTPSTVDGMVRPAVDRLLERGRGDIASIGVVLTFWSASRATAIFMETVRIAYDIPDGRPLVRRRMIAIGITVGGLLATAALLPVLVVGPRAAGAVAQAVGARSIWDEVWRIAYWPVVGATGVVMLATLYHVVAGVRTPWTRDLPGALLAIGLWLAGGVGLRVYAALSFGRDSVYGPLAAPTVVLLWLYLTSVALLLGAEVNAEIEKRWPASPEGRAARAGLPAAAGRDGPAVA